MFTSIHAARKQLRPTRLPWTPPSWSRRRYPDRLVHDVVDRGQHPVQSRPALRRFNPDLAAIHRWSAPWGMACIGVGVAGVQIQARDQRTGQAVAR